MVTTQNLTNPLGAIVLFDGEVPRTFTAKAREVISGGNLVNTSGATGDVGSQSSSFIDGDLQVVLTINEELCNGIALNNAGSNELVSIATRGAFLMNVSDHGVSGGALVVHNLSGGVTNVSGTGVPKNSPIGRAMSTSTSGTDNFALIYLNL